MDISKLTAKGLLRWMLTSENRFARWLRTDFEEVKPLNPLIPLSIQERINRAEFDAAVYGKNPVPEYERIYDDLIKSSLFKGS